MWATQRLSSRHDQYKLLLPLHDLDFLIKLSTDPPMTAFVSLLHHIQLSRRLDVYYILGIASDTLPLLGKPLDARQLADQVLHFLVYSTAL